MARLGSGIPVWMDRMEVCLEGAVKEAGNPNGAGTGQGGLVGDEPVWLCCVRFPTILSLPHADPHPHLLLREPQVPSSPHPPLALPRTDHQRAAPSPVAPSETTQPPGQSEQWGQRVPPESQTPQPPLKAVGALRPVRVCRWELGVWGWRGAVKKELKKWVRPGGRDSPKTDSQTQEEPPPNPRPFYR